MTSGRSAALACAMFPLIAAHTLPLLRMAVIIRRDSDRNTDTSKDP